MITYAWRDDLSRDDADEVAGLLDEAADYDAEAGFSTARPELDAGPGERVVHLLVSMPPKGSRGSPHLDRLPDVRVVAYARLVVDAGGGADGRALAALVVRPDFRSLGVTTLLFERLASEADGWRALDGVRAVEAWAHGGHPAAERLSWRFRAELDGELCKTLRMIGGARPFEPDPALPDLRRSSVDAVAAAWPGHDDGLARADLAARTEGDRVRLVVGDHGAVVIGATGGTLEEPRLIALEPGDDPDKDDLRALIGAGVVEAQDQGARVVMLYVDTDDELLLHVSRELDFFHDQSDRRYVLNVDLADGADRPR